MKFIKAVSLEEHQKAAASQPDGRYVYEASYRSDGTNWYAVLTKAFA